MLDPDHLPPQLGLVQVVDGQEGLLWLSCLYQGCVLLVEQESVAAILLEMMSSSYHAIADDVGLSVGVALPCQLSCLCRH